MRYRIDIRKDDEWRPGDILFHPDTPMETLESIAREIARAQRSQTRIVKVHTIKDTFVTQVCVFELDAA